MKLLVFLAVTLCAVAGAIALVVRASPRVEPCAERIVSGTETDQHHAAVSERTCEGVVTTHVRLDPGRAGPQGAEVFAAEGAAEVQLDWREPRLLVIETSAKVLREETRWRDVSVQVRRKR